MNVSWDHHHGRPGSPIHRLGAAPKLGFALLLIVATVLMPIEHRAWFAGVAGVLLLTVLLSRLPLLFLARRLLMLSPFVLGVVLVNAILRVLKSIRVPSLLITTIALMHRYLFVLLDESERMRRARASRTFTQRRPFHWHTLGTVVGQLFIRASERAERIYDAMCARGWK